MCNSVPHKHRDLIIAWANGAEIQYWAGASDKWVDTRDPEWRQAVIYRVRPEPKNIYYRNALVCVPALSPSCYVTTAHNPREEQHIGGLPHFVKWLGDWQEVIVE